MWIFIVCLQFYFSTEEEMASMQSKKQNQITYSATQGGEGEVVGQLSCIYETITTKI